MVFVVVNAQTGCRVQHPRTGKGSWNTERAARAAATRISKLCSLDQLVVMDHADYHAQVPVIEVTNLMTGQPVKIPADTPWHCRPDSEAYWSK